MTGAYPRQINADNYFIIVLPYVRIEFQSSKMDSFVD